MSQATLLFSAATALASGLLFSFVGFSLKTRDLKGEDRTALLAFALWWQGLAALVAYSAITSTLAAVDRLDANLLITLTHPLLLLLFLAVWGLTYYLSYLYLGRPTLKIPLAAFFTLLYLWTTYLFVAAHAHGITVGPWSASLEYERDIASFRGASLLGPLVLGPAFLAALGYFFLLFKVREPILRYRIGLVAASVLVWFGSSLVATFAGISTAAWWPMVTRAISMVAALVVLAAYRPPAWVRARLTPPAAPAPTL